MGKIDEARETLSGSRPETWRSAIWRLTLEIADFTWPWATPRWRAIGCGR